MVKITGILPMAGTGSRLGLPFPKGLAPTIDVDGSLVPLYAHAARRLRVAGAEVRFVVGPDPDPCLVRLPGTVVRKPDRGELPSSLAFAAADLHPDDIVVVALPDSVWSPIDGLVHCVAHLEVSDADVVLGVFLGSSLLLDEVTVDGPRVVAIDRHEDPPARPRGVFGWGTFAARASVLQALTDDEPLGPQLARFNTEWEPLDEYADLGTPERYIAFHDLRSWA